MEMGLPWWSSGLRLQISIAQDTRLFSGLGTKVHLLPSAAKKKKKERKTQFFLFLSVNKLVIILCCT